MFELVLAPDYSTREAAELAGIPAMTLHRMERAGIITSSVPAAGTGSKRRWSAAEVDRLCRIGEVQRRAHDAGLLVTWAAVAAMWDGLGDGSGWSVTLAA